MPAMPKLRDKLRALKAALVAEVDQIMRSVAIVALARIKSLTPEDTGRTAAGWFIKVIGGGGKGGAGTSLIVIDHPFNKPGAKHPITRKLVNGLVNGKDFNLLEALEFGTRAHLITPKTFGPGFGASGKAINLGVFGLAGLSGTRIAGGGSPGYLRFKIGDRWVTTREVHHPGTRAYYPVTIAATEADQQLVERLSAVREKARAILDAGP